MTLELLYSKPHRGSFSFFKTSLSIHVPSSQNHRFFLFVSSTIFSRKRAYKNDKLGVELQRGFVNIGKTEIKPKQISQRYLGRSRKLYTKSILCVFIVFDCMLLQLCPLFLSLSPSTQLHPALPQTIPISLSAPVGHAQMFFGYFLTFFLQYCTPPPQLSVCSMYLCFSF